MNIQQSEAVTKKYATEEAEAIAQSNEAIVKLYYGITKTQAGLEKRRKEVKREIEKRGLKGIIGTHSVTYADGVNYRYQALANDALGEVTVAKLRDKYKTEYTRLSIKKA